MPRIRRPLGTVLVAAAIALGTGGLYVATQGGGGGGPAAACDQSISTRAEVLTALTTGGNAGQIICVTADITGSAISTTTDMASEMRLVAQPLDSTVAMVELTCNGCSNITVDGFEFTGETGITLTGDVQSFWMIRNYFHDQQRSGVRINGSGHDDVRVLANTFTNLNCPAGQCSGPTSSGYGVNGDVTQTNFKYSYNDCSSPTAKTADCIEIGSLDGAELIGNNLHDMPDAGEAHGDAIMVWSGSQDVLLQDNRLVDVFVTLWSPDTDRLTARNNLIARTDNRCVDADNNLTSGEVQPLDWVIDNNTVVDCVFEAWMMDGESLSGRGSNIMTDNILQRETGGTNFDITAPVAGCRDATFETFTGNVLSSAQTCSLSTGTNAFSQTTTWTNTVDYLPTNLPGGYTSAGYRLAPNGPSACGEAQGCAADPADGTPAVACDGAPITTRAALNTAMTSTGSAGQTLCVTADITGAVIETTTSMPSEAEFVAQPADGTIQFPPLDFGGSASNITVYGAEWTGGSGYSVDIGSGANNIHIIKGNCHDQLGNCVNPGGTNSWIIGTRFVNIEYDAGFPHGNGIYGSGSFGSGAKLNYNYCDGGSVISDCMEVGGMTNFEIVGNVMFNAFPSGNGAHNDTLMLWNDSHDGIVKDNRLWHGLENLWSPTGTDIVYENNLITDHDQCVGMHGSGTAGEPNEPPLRNTIRNNTLGGCSWTMCGAGAMPACTGSGRGNNVIEDNIFGGMVCRAQDISVDGGNVTDDASNSCFEGTNSFGWTASWQNTSDPFSPSYYIPSSLPSGYEGAGYQYVPAGPDACGPTEGCKYG